MIASSPSKIENCSNTKERFKLAIDFFKKRSPVIFVSQHYRYWDLHGFVQQSLAKVLVESGVPVYWLDGAHWKKNRPIQTWNSPLLKISQLPCLPLRRIPFIESLNTSLQTWQLKTKLKMGKNPFLWIHSGLDERIASELPYVDVFSVFDDPYLHSPQGALSKKANLIVAQNEFTGNIYKEYFADKTTVLFPPVDMNPATFSDGGNFSFPENFPINIICYIGSFFSDGFDLVLFEDFIRSFPDWGFVLGGRTDSSGMKKIETWKKYPNFIYVPWVPRKQIGALWKRIKVNLMLYRPTPASHGAFPVKLLEALYYQIPSITTQVPKTSSLEGVIPRLTFPQQIKLAAIKLGLHQIQDVASLYKYFSNEMDPKIHLIRVAENHQDQAISRLMK